MKNKAIFLIALAFLIVIACQSVTPLNSNPPTSEAIESAPTPSSAPLAGLIYGTYDEGTNERALWQIGEDGKAHVLLSDRNSATFSPDGKQAVFYDNYWETGSGCTWLADSVKREVKSLDCGSEPSFPDTVLVWIPNDPNTVLAILDQTGGGMGGSYGYLGTISLAEGTSNILDSEHEIQSVEISPNGEMIAYAQGIYSLGSGYRDFDPAEYGVKEPYTPDNPSWSPDGEKIAWGLLSADANYQYHASFGIFDLANKTAQILFPPFIPKPVGESYAPAVPYAFWSPDGNWLAVNSLAQKENGEYDPEQSGWRIISTDGQTKYKIDGEFDGWSPDSQWILYVAHEETDVFEYRVARLDGSEITKLGEVDSMFTYYQSDLWSQDGRYLVFADGNNAIQLTEVGIWQLTDITDQFAVVGTSASVNLVDWIALIDSSFESMTVLPTPTSQPIFSCPSAPRTRLQVGDTARITFTDGTTTFLRSAPEAGDNVIDKLPEGTELEIISGPICYPRPSRNDSYVFWEILVPSRNNRTGWAAEGDFDGYYIEPWP